MEGFSLDSLIDVLAERVAARIDSRQRSGSGVESKRLLTMDEAGIFLGRTKDSNVERILIGQLFDDLIIKAVLRSADRVSPKKGRR